MERTQKNIRNDDAEASGWDNTEKERLSVRKRKKKQNFPLSTITEYIQEKQNKTCYDVLLF